ncbi:MAG: hypothetical protein J6A89_04315 [Clostridia bacterium]|nr:hypothetical protein [Clostridia bacterium]MBQ7030918.1 hypothetical protein [Bacilli bacterium]
MNKTLEKKIEKIELMKTKELENRKKVEDKISDLDQQLKVLYDFKKKQEKIYQMQQELDNQISEK